MAILKNNPYAGFNFTVTVEGSEPAAFSTVIIPTVEIDVVEYRDGNDRTNQPRQVVGLTKYTNLVLKRGIANHPETAAARAALEKAQLDMSRTVIRAPIDGIVAQRKAQVGQSVQPGQALMTVSPIAQAYVDANFKEGQLSDVRVGQPVTLTSDLYGSKTVFHGKVTGMGGGTGSAFAVIPAQNATGNWIKVVQRVPVRIALAPKELTAHPLRVGLSMTATIDTQGH